MQQINNDLSTCAVAKKQRTQELTKWNIALEKSWHQQLDNTKLTNKDESLILAKINKLVAKKSKVNQEISLAQDFVKFRQVNNINARSQIKPNQIKLLSIIKLPLKLNFATQYSRQQTLINIVNVKPSHFKVCQAFNLQTKFDYNNCHYFIDKQKRLHLSVGLTPSQFKGSYNILRSLAANSSIVELRVNGELISGMSKEDE